MNKSKAIISIFVIAMFAVSIFAAVPVHAQTTLLAPGQLQVLGSSTVFPISFLVKPMFQTYTGTLTAPFVSTSVTLNDLGSGAGITALQTGTADIAASSKDGAAGGIFAATYPKAGTTLNDPEEFMIGQDSIAIIVPATNTWLTQASASQVADLFRVTANHGSTPLYTTWGDWANAQVPAVTLPAGVASQNIVHIGREFSAGTFDGFNTFFLKPFGFDMAYSAASGTTAGVWTTGDYQPKTANQDVLAAVSSGSPYSIGFIGVGFVQNDLGASHPDGIIPLKLYNPTTGTYIVPSIAHVKDGSYVNNPPAPAIPSVIVRGLWYFMDGIPAATNAEAAKSLWISYVKSDDSFLSNNGYITINRADMAGKASGNPSTTVGTQTIPDGVVDFNDLVYFASSWIAYYGPTHQLNPYADITGPNGHPDGVIDFNDLVSFANSWIAYYSH